MATKVRKVELKDLKGIMRLAKVANKENKWWALETEAELKKIHAADKNMLWVAEENNGFVGFLVGDLIEKKNLVGEKAKVPEVASIFVLQSYRRKGIASKLLKAFESNLKPRYFSGKKRYLLAHAVSNSSYNVFKKLGFKQEVHLMQKRLT
jgi:GNAT superfamily N-acetyltransferase